MNSISLKSYYHIHALLTKSIRPDVLKKCEAGNTLLSNTAPYRCSFKSLGWIRLLAYRRAKPIAKYLGKKDTTDAGTQNRCLFNKYYCNEGILNGDKMS